MPVQCNFISGVAPVDTNHFILFIEAFSLAISTEIPDFGLSRYYIRSLEHPCTCASLRGHFKAVASFLKSLLTDALGFTSSMDIVTKQSMINELNELELISLASCCAPALGVYRVGYVCLSPDRLNSHFSSCTNFSEAVKLFKRANKSVAQTVLQSETQISLLKMMQLPILPQCLANLIHVFKAFLLTWLLSLAPLAQSYSATSLLPMLRHISSATQSLCLVALISCTLKFLKLCYSLA
ncbi:hypothetical protein DSO57_1014819 [Entomophthora muscae]|uniref:Uncharacterized protein n=1 Tax=Entomophthora muscae TaxID=34485 RepID=A0ACC2RK06_9FUNG|nr:hypothetical protein DSO57_1014819 [Entomophthora muscae]